MKTLKPRTLSEAVRKAKPLKVEIIKKGIIIQRQHQPKKRSDILKIIGVVLEKVR